MSLAAVHFYFHTLYGLLFLMSKDLFQYSVFKVQSRVLLLLQSLPDTCASDGDKGIRTLDPLLARQVLSQLSYTP